MSARVYLSKNDSRTTPEEDTPVCIRIQRSRATVKDLHHRLQHAYQRDEVRLVRRTTVLIDLLVYDVPMPVWCERWGLSPSCLYPWRQDFLLHGGDSLVSRHGGGRRPKLTPRQRKRLAALLEAGPQVVGCETACWDSVLIRGLLWRECGVLYNRYYVCTVLHNLGFSCQKARLVSDHFDAARRPEWLHDPWPQMLRAAKRCQGLILFEDEARFAQWGSLSYSWARRGQQPAVKTSGKRKGYKGLGAMAYGSGRLFSQGMEGRFTSDSSHAFLTMILAQTTAQVCLIHDGARYHTSKATQQFLEAHGERITAHPLRITRSQLVHDRRGQFLYTANWRAVRGFPSRRHVAICAWNAASKGWTSC
jgi:transposase